MIGTMTACPHCGQETELLLALPAAESGVPRKAIYWSIAAFIMLGLGLSGALIALRRAEKMVARQKQHAAALVPVPEATNSFDGTETSTNAPSQADLSVSEITLEKTAGSSLVYAVGTVKNSSNRQRFGVKIQLALLDATGQKVGSATDYRQMLEPQSQWQFKALVVDSKAVSARLESVRDDQ